MSEKFANKKFSLRQLFVGRLDSTNYFLVVILSIPANFLSRFGDSIIEAHPIITLLIIIPTIVVLVGSSIRRLHDLGRTGWLTALLFVPVLGFFFALVLWLKKGQQIPNQYGDIPDPKKNVFAAVFNVP